MEEYKCSKVIRMCLNSTVKPLTRGIITILDIGFPVTGLANDIERQSRRTFNRCQAGDSIFPCIIASTVGQRNLNIIPRMCLVVAKELNRGINRLDGWDLSDVSCRVANLIRYPCPGSLGVSICSCL